MRNLLYLLLLFASTPLSCAASAAAGAGGLDIPDAFATLTADQARAMSEVARLQELLNNQEAKAGDFTEFIGIATRLQDLEDEGFQWMGKCFCAMRRAVLAEDEKHRQATLIRGLQAQASLSTNYAVNGCCLLVTWAVGRELVPRLWRRYRARICACFSRAQK